MIPTPPTSNDFLYDNIIFIVFYCKRIAFSPETQEGSWAVPEVNSKKKKFQILSLLASVTGSPSIWESRHGMERKRTRSIISVFLFSILLLKTITHLSWLIHICFRSYSINLKISSTPFKLLQPPLFPSQIQFNSFQLHVQCFFFLQILNSFIGKFQVCTVIHTSLLIYVPLSQTTSNSSNENLDKKVDDCLRKLLKCPSWRLHSRCLLLLDDLSNALYHRFEPLGAIEYLKESITCRRQCSNLCPIGDPNRSVFRRCHKDSLLSN